VNYLIDTNVISEVRKGLRCNPNVTAWFEAVDDDSLYLSVLVLGEIRRGVERSRSKDPRKARALESWLISVATSFASRILPVDHAVANEWGRMSAERPISTVDALLAATATVNRMTLVTRNISDVADLGADVLDPFAWQR
jgi:predicted nucleic acid-binding protein